jgi:hypothetical protein
LDPGRRTPAGRWKITVSTHKSLAPNPPVEPEESDRFLSEERDYVREDIRYTEQMSPFKNGTDLSRFRETRKISLT